MDFPFVVTLTVTLAPHRKSLLQVIVIADTITSLPVLKNEMFPEPANVPVKPVQTIAAMTTAPDFVIVTFPLLASKKTVSLVDGTLAPPDPPEVVAHLVPAVVFHVFVPPTQYREAPVSINGHKRSAIRSLFILLKV